MSEHTKEPWRITNDGTFVEVMAGKKTVLPAIRKSEAGEDFRRIVACVNACEGFATDTLESGNLYEAFLNEKQQRDELLNALHQISLASQNSMSSQRECGAIARAAIAKVKP